MDDPIPFGEVLLDVETVLAAFAAHDVAYVLVGGIASQLHGSPLTTEDIDLTPRDDARNLDRCASALADLDAQWRVTNLTEGFPPVVPLTGSDLAGELSAAFVTRSGFIDIVLRHSDGADYDALADTAEPTMVYDIGITVASLDRIIASKEAAGRDEDRRALPFLYELRRRR